MTIRMKTFFCIVRGCPLIFTEAQAPTCPTHDKAMKQVDLVRPRQGGGWW